MLDLAIDANTLDEAIPAQFLQDLEQALDQAGTTLQEVVGDDNFATTPAAQFYLAGATFLEVGYTLLEQLALSFPAVFRMLYVKHYGPLFQRAQRGQINWTEALDALPEFVVDYAENRVHAQLALSDDDDA